MNCRCVPLCYRRVFSYQVSALRFLKIVSTWSSSRNTRVINTNPQKCDGNKPVCGPCRRHPKEDECEYSDGPGRSRTKALEEQVLRLEARLQELENPEATTPSVKLHDPYAQYHELQRLSRSPPIIIPPEPAPYAPLSPFSPTSTSSSLPSGRHWNTFAALKPKTEPTGSSGSSSHSPLRYLPSSSPFLGAEVCFSSPLPQHSVLIASAGTLLPSHPELVSVLLSQAVLTP
jgi:hypothetical protein